MAGTTLLLVIAGVVEGLISPNPWIPREGKLAIAGFNAVVLLWYLLFAGRGETARRAAETAAER